MSDSTHPPKHCMLYKSDATQASFHSCWNGLSDFQSLVGGNIEPVRIFNRDGSEMLDLVMLVNEEGIPLDMPINLIGSILAKQTLRGDVVVVHKSYLN